jgi:glycosyltransferase involved in cell wall biosynthesis
MDRGGIQTWLVHLLGAARRQLESHVLVHATDPGDLDDEVRSRGAKIIRCVNPRYNPLFYTWDLLRTLRAEGPYDVVHCHVREFSGWVLMVARLAGVSARVAHSHNDLTRRYAGAGLAHRPWMALMRRLIDRHATAGLAASREAAAGLYGPRWEADRRWRVLHCGIDLAAFGADPPDRTTLRAGLGIPSGAFVAGHVGRFTEQKNHRFLIDVAAEAARREPDFRLLLVGQGELRPTIEARVARLGLSGRVIFAGSRTDVPHLMRGAMDVLVLPSLYEGLPIVGIEALAAGLPALISDVITPELDVVPGLVRRMPLAAPASAWAEALLRGRGDRRSIAPRDALRVVERSGFNIEACVEELMRAYEAAGAV